MKKLITFTFLFIFILTSFSQNKVDELVENYGEEQVILNTSNGELIGKSEIKRNIDNKPFSIKIKGSTSDSEKIAELFLSLFKDKEKEGYKLSYSDPTMNYTMNKRTILWLISGDNVDGGLKVEYAKDKYLFKASATEMKDDSRSNKVVKTEVYQAGSIEHINRLNEDILEEPENRKKKEKFYEFVIEMIDTSRIGGKKSVKFKF